MMLLSGILIFKPSTVTYAATTVNYTATTSASAAVTEPTVTYTITTDAQYVNRYTPAKRICGYVKDSNGNAVANKTVYIAYYDSRYSIPKSNQAIIDVYSKVTTDANGYYSTWAYTSGYYVAYLADNNSVRDITYALVNYD